MLRPEFQNFKSYTPDPNIEFLGMRQEVKITRVVKHRVLNDDEAGKDASNPYDLTGPSIFTNSVGPIEYASRFCLCLCLCLFYLCSGLILQYQDPTMHPDPTRIELYGAGFPTFPVNQ